MSKKKKTTNSTYEVVRKIRGDWGQVKPFTRVETDKRFKKPKHIKRERENWFKE